MEVLTKLKTANGTIPETFDDPIAETDYIVRRIFGVSRTLLILPWVGFGASSLFSVFLLVMLGSRLMAPPSIVAVHPGTSGPISGMLLEGKNAPDLSDEQIASELMWFIRNIRQVLRDGQANAESIEWSTTHILDGQAFSFITEWFSSLEGSLDRMKRKEAVHVHVETVNRMGSSKTYLAKWQETVTDRSGNTIDSYRMTGSFQVEILDTRKMDLRPDRRRIMELNNPYGWFVQEVSWSRDIPGGTK